MNTYVVEVKVSGREVYYVDADSPEEAKQNWPEGVLHVSEMLDAEPVDVKPI